MVCWSHQPDIFPKKTQWFFQRFPTSKDLNSPRRESLNLGHRTGVSRRSYVGEWRVGRKHHRCIRWNPPGIFSDKKKWTNSPFSDWEIRKISLPDFSTCSYHLFSFTFKFHDFFPCFFPFKSYFTSWFLHIVILEITCFHVFFPYENIDVVFWFKINFRNHFFFHFFVNHINFGLIRATPRSMCEVCCPFRRPGTSFSPESAAQGVTGVSPLCQP